MKDEILSITTDEYNKVIYIYIIKNEKNANFTADIGKTSKIFQPLYVRILPQPLPNGQNFMYTRWR